MLLLLLTVVRVSYSLLQGLQVVAIVDQPGSATASFKDFMLLLLLTVARVSYSLLQGLHVVAIVDCSQGQLQPPSRTSCCCYC